jgi:hypothetical protein
MHRVLQFLGCLVLLQSHWAMADSETSQWICEDFEQSNLVSDKPAPRIAIDTARHYIDKLEGSVEKASGSRISESYTAKQASLKTIKLLKDYKYSEAIASLRLRYCTAIQHAIGAKVSLPENLSKSQDIQNKIVSLVSRESKENWDSFLVTGESYLAKKPV